MATVITSRSESVLHYLNPVAMARNLWQHRDLIRQFTRREIEGRYKGSFLGLFWSFINPLVLLLIYTFVFGVVLKSRWPEARTDNLGEFAVILFAGLIIFNVFSDSVGRSPAMITGVPNYVKKVVFPLEVLPVSIVGAALFHSIVSLVILLVANIIISGRIALTILLVPIIVLPLVLLCLGFTWFLASLGVFIRDVGYSISLIIQVLLFLTPIFYPITSIQEPFLTFIHLNPLTNIVENFRAVVLWFTTPDWLWFGVWLVISLGVAVFGYAWFMKTKKAFADVI